MSTETGISWAQSTWNPMVGCTKVSAGCDNCYAETLVNRFAGHNKGFPERFDTMVLRDDTFMLKPLSWRTPRRIFVNSLSDLFHKDVPDEFVARVFAVMSLADHHTFELLTKRHGRMRSLLNSHAFRVLVDDQREAIRPGCGDWTWPLPNLWLGVSVEDQASADLRIPALLDTPAALRWLSMEPLLGPVDLVGVLDDGCQACGPAISHESYVARTDYGTGVEYDCTHEFGIDWVVVGGESGHGARPMRPAWVHNIHADCDAAGVPFHFKQLGSVLAREMGRSGKGDVPADWAAIGWPRQYPAVTG